MCSKLFYKKKKKLLEDVYLEEVGFLRLGPVGIISPKSKLKIEVMEPVV